MKLIIAEKPMLARAIASAIPEPAFRVVQGTIEVKDGSLNLIKIDTVNGAVE